MNLSDSATLQRLVDSLHVLVKPKESPMNTARPHFSRPTLALLMLGVALASASAMAASKTASADALARYQQERAVCTSGQSNQDRATCLREAGAAYAQARQEGSVDEDEAQYSSNARKRCERLPDSDRRDCMARMDGQGTTSGSAAAGGISRELVTRETVPPSRAGGASAVPVK
jgi:hypothetical protein